MFNRLIPALGRFLLTIVFDLGRIAALGVESISKSIWPDFSPAKISRAIYEIGIKCIPLISIVSLFTGMVLGLQGFVTLRQFGSESLLGSTLALTIIPELGPVLTALLIVGQAGSSTAAEIGIQRNSEQIDALKTMGINPKTFLVGPRILAALIVFPLLTTIFDIVGLWGGYLSGVVIMGGDGGAFWATIQDVLTWEEIIEGYIKAFVFGGITILICCHEGYYTHAKSHAFGARGVSQSATNAVVLSSIAILACDFIITSFQI